MNMKLILTEDNKPYSTMCHPVSPTAPKIRYAERQENVTIPRNFIFKPAKDYK